jgi:hypothetical protein
MPRAKIKPALTAKRLRQLLIYDADTGIMRWKPRSGVKAGSIAGSKTAGGYVRICVDGRGYRRSRLAWLYTRGRWPRNLVDHIDGRPGNDRLSNLRGATHSQNAANARQRPGLSGIRGVRARRRKGGPTVYEARIKVNGKLRQLGTYPTITEAYLVRGAAERKHHGVFSIRERPASASTGAA